MQRAGQATCACAQGRSHGARVLSSSSSSWNSGRCRPRTVSLCCHAQIRCMWSRPTPDKDRDFVKPSYVPDRQDSPVVQPRRDDQPLYAPTTPEFQPNTERPDKEQELPEGPKVPERGPEPIPAGNPKEKPPSKSTPEEEPPSKREKPDSAS